MRLRDNTVNTVPPEMAGEFRAMFEGREHSLAWPSGIGWRPWWPPIGEIWESRGTPPEGEYYGRPVDEPMRQTWAAAWDLVESLYSEFME